MEPSPIGNKEGDFLNIIEAQQLTKDYGNGKGIFDVSLSIKEGEIYGYLGANGAGKSTTMRLLMGFIKAQSGTVSIGGMDCWHKQKIIQRNLGYLPGEISFPDEMTGIGYLKLIAKMRNMKDFRYTEELLHQFHLDPDTGIKRMSKGMKQKLGIVSAFMHDPDILLLDEPTSGLDPLMQNRFVELVETEKNKGKTILLSSHIFEEVEKTCDRVGMIRHGKLLREVTIDELRHSQLKTYIVTFADSSNLPMIKKSFPHGAFKKENQMVISIKDAEINHFIAQLAKYELYSLKEERHSLEEYFMQFYGGNEDV